MKDLLEKKAKILIIDDDTIVHFLISEILAEEDYLTEYASSGMEGLKKAREQNIDLILLDIMIPEMDGFDVCERLQKDPETSGIPVIFLSAKDDEQSYIRGFGLGAIDYLTKPINHLDLKLRIRNYLKLSRNETKLRESERKFRNIFQSSVDSIIITDNSFNIIEANPTFRNITGLDAEDLSGMKITEFVHPNDLESFKNWLGSYYSPLPANRPSEVRIIGESRAVRTVEIKSQMIEYQGMQAIMSILRDVTERKEMHLRILNTIIETEEKERRRFAQDLHDGMGPLLSTIKLYTRSIITARDEQHKEIALEKSLETIDEAITCTKEIANNISPSILKDFGIGVAINSYVNKFNDTKKVNINFRSDFERRFSSNIEASIFRIVIELINNTIKHASANNVLIELKSENDLLLMNYTDDGIGCEINDILKKHSGQGMMNIINRTHSIGGEVVFDSSVNKGFNAKINLKIDN
ncbi:MAG: response regulator [Bacteroidota bacterium]